MTESMGILIVALVGTLGMVAIAYTSIRVILNTTIEAIRKHKSEEKQ